MEEGSCLFLSSGMLEGYTGLPSGCTSSSWWSHRERLCINENMGIFWGLGHLNFTVMKEVRVLEEGKRVGLCSGKWAWLLILVWEVRRAYVNKYQFIMFWSKKDYPLRKSNLCLWVYVLCLGEFEWFRVIESCTKCWAVNIRTRHPQLQFL